MKGGSCITFDAKCNFPGTPVHFSDAICHNAENRERNLLLSFNTKHHFKTIKNDVCLMFTKLREIPLDIHNASLQDALPGN